MYKAPTGKVRASRDGHEFHETWTARIALQLLLPTDNLVGISVEGLPPADQRKAASETVEIADIAMYYGNSPTFADAETVNIVQFKYSVSHKDIDFRNSHAKKTIRKFAAAFIDYKIKYSAKNVRDKLQFELTTNRPIYPAFEQAITCIADSQPLKGEVKKQADQFEKACGLSGKQLVEFAGKFRITGQAGSLSSSKLVLSRTIVDWSGASDATARARLGTLKQMVRDKAGSAGTDKNVIRWVDVLAALDVQDKADLFPCPTSFPEIGPIVEREQLGKVLSLIPQLDKPLLIHAAGGIGKTVFLESLAKSLSEQHEVVLFDCFGGGSYRAPDDARHLPKRGLIHIVNTLACRGLCDPLLPGNEHVEELIKAFRRRLKQSVDTIKAAVKETELILLIDAIDNAAEHANDNRQLSFPTLLLESFQYNRPIPGVRLVVSCRTHRIQISVNEVPCQKLELEPFSLSETGIYLRDRLSKLTQTEIQVAQSRSGGNPRILEHLVSSDRGVLDQSEINNTIVLDDLLNRRIQEALSGAFARGNKQSQTNAFLAGLSVLPPPVPLKEYADAHGMDISAVESFAADLAPLLERTRHGLMFRDEPTETLIRDKFGSDINALRRVAKNLLNQQDRSVYAARALPGLLLRLDDGKQLFELAFNESFPEAITSMVGKHNIRYARLKTAAVHAASNQDYNQLVRLLVELSMITALNQRGSEYILDYPDLVIAADDVDAMRRLFEIRTFWPGTRHARLTIANAMSGDYDDASRHAVMTEEWIFHHREQPRDHGMERVGPVRLDHAALPFYLITQNRINSALKYMRGWKHWYAYEVGVELFGLLERAHSVMSRSVINLDAFWEGMAGDIGIIASALSTLEIEQTQSRQLILKLTKACKEQERLKFDTRIFYDEGSQLQEGLLKAAAIAVSRGLNFEASIINSVATHERPKLWSFSERFPDQYIFPFLAQVALNSAVKGKEPSAQDILPKELSEICSSYGITGTKDEISENLKKHLEHRDKLQQEQHAQDKVSLSNEDKRDAERFINDKLGSLIILTAAFSQLIAAPIGQGDQAFIGLMEAWSRTRKKTDRYRNDSEKFDRFFQLLGYRVVMFALRIRSDIGIESVAIFLDRLHEQDILGSSRLIDVVAILAKRSHLHSYAGEQALRATVLIDYEDDVSTRATLYAQLARSILPASRDEATVYFKMGLDQMDAIGSGDYQFTNELLLFASSLRGNELSEHDFHTLTNICELNMTDETEKFPWLSFATGLSNVSGCKTLAKLSRWDDRSKISLEYTLLPYLTALVKDGKIGPEYALALNRLADPVELIVCNTESFAEAIDERYPNQELFIRELIRQFEENNSGTLTFASVGKLVSIAKGSLGTDSETASYISAAHEHFSKVRDEINEQMNYRGQSDPQVPTKDTEKELQVRHKLRELAARTIPDDAVSIVNATDELREMGYIYNITGEFFDKLRSLVPYSTRSQYIQTIARHETLSIHTKIDELKKCKIEWQSSSASLTSKFETFGLLLIRLHTDDFVSFDHLSSNMLKEVSALSGVPIKTLALEFIRLLVTSGSAAAAAVWLGLAGIICDETDAGVGQLALANLLNSNAAKLADTVIDGDWVDGLYPKDDITDIASGLIWRMLGSPRASDRWRAAHSIRCLARFNKWDVVDALVASFPKEDAHPYQAPELPFYYMHSRLWLIIALARIALDNPERISQYEGLLMDIALDDVSPHVLLRHFASKAILACVEGGNLSLPSDKEKMVRDVDRSPFPRMRKKLKDGMRDSFYQGRPEHLPKPEFDFLLDYDFDKLEVRNLSNIFGKPRWEVKDLISSIVHKMDSTITDMYEGGGRETSHRAQSRGMTSEFHNYGQYLGWHAFLITAGDLFGQYPVTDDSYDDEPWEEFLSKHILTRKDGLWLSDGMDRPPLSTKVNLLEKGAVGLVITGDKDKILGLVELDSTIVEEIVVDGYWKSPDKVKINISSSLVVPGKAQGLAKTLIMEEPFSVWLPKYTQYEDEGEYQSSDKKDYIPWLTRPSTVDGLDKNDPLGVSIATNRPRFADGIVNTFSLVSDDPFCRIWKNSAQEPVAHSEAWGFENQHDDERSNNGVRLVCSGEFLNEILTKQDKDLLILVDIERYEKGFGRDVSKYSHTIAVVHINQSQQIHYYPGAVNRIHEMKY